MSKHTPGPWSHSPATPPPNVQVNGADGSIVATLFSGEANARLISAAPDLLNVCELLHVRLFHEQGGQEDSPWATPLRLLSAAIAKAKGETP